MLPVLRDRKQQISFYHLFYCPSLFVPYKRRFLKWMAVFCAHTGV
uniref:Uncharacterized protein n=1 Tax=Anguilla anguilla TaxID=7936 RepID=A0A0E9P882_ANGAN